MGELEKKSRKNSGRADVQKIVLGTVATMGILSVSLLAPNVLGTLGRLGLLPTRRQTDTIRAARNRLVQRGFLKYDGNKLRLTEAGKKKLRSLELHDYQIPRPKRWDKKWRVLVFDIPETRRSLREKVRRTLMEVGFIRLQDSVWIFPYPCEDLITLLKADFKIGKDVLYMIVDTLEYDTSFRKKFDLKS